MQVPAPAGAEGQAGTGAQQGGGVESAPAASIPEQTEAESLGSRFAPALHSDSSPSAQNGEQAGTASGEAKEGTRGTSSEEITSSDSDASTSSASNGSASESPTFGVRAVSREANGSVHPPGSSSTGAALNGAAASEPDATLASLSPSSAFEIKAADEAGFYAAKTLPPATIGHWGRRYTSDEERSKEFEVICGMLDGFDDAAALTEIPSAPSKLSLPRTAGGEASSATSAEQGTQHTASSGEPEEEKQASPPFTIQRLCEQILDPHKHYTSLPKFVAAVKRTLSVTAGKCEFLRDAGEDEESRDQLENSMDLDLAHGSTANGPASEAASSLNGSATPRPSSSRRSSNASLHEPLWSPIPFLVRQEQEELEAASNKSQTSATGETSLLDADQEMAAGTPSHDDPSAATSSSMTPSAASTIAAAVHDASAPGKAAPAEPVAATAQPMQPLGVPDGRVDELDDTALRGKTKGGHPGQDVEMHPISSTTSSRSSPSALPEAQAAAPTDEDLLRDTKRSRSDAETESTGNV